MTIDGDGNFHKFDDTKEKIENINPSDNFNPQHLIYFNKLQIIYFYIKGFVIELFDFFSDKKMKNKI